MTPHKRIRLRWTGEALVFEGAGTSGAGIVIDGDAERGPSPTDTLLLSLAACMAIDVRTILEKSRVAVSSLEFEVEGERMEEPPKRFHTLRMTCRVEGPSPDDMPKLERALRLSHDRYCSVMHSLRSDLDITSKILRA
jgi:putative redox protein